MTKNELIARLKDIEWDDFEAKEAASELPKSVWESVSGDRRATDMEVMAMFRDQAFGTKSEQIVPDSSLAHANYFSPAHSTIRILADRIEFQNPGRFPFDLK